jgi:AraC-like DNA-binding protein
MSGSCGCLGFFIFICMQDDKELEGYPKFYLYKRIVQAKLFIDNHSDENIDLDKISNEAYFSKFHFIRLFKKIYGKTPHQYLVKVRLEKAKQLLSKGVAIAEVCASIGFESVSTFSGKFKIAFGETPGSYLSNQAKRRRELAVQPLKFIPGCISTRNGWLKDSNFEESGRE